jgi:integrase
VYDTRTGTKLQQTFRNLAEAKGWRSDASSGLRRGTMRAPTQTTLCEAWEAWLVGARDGSIRTRTGDRYKPSAIRAYEASMRIHILDDLGAAKLSQISRLDIQAIADRMLAAEAEPSTIRNALMPLKVLYRRAVGREVAVNPTTGLELPAVRGRRDRIASVEQAAALIDALPDNQKAVWACAFYAGLRLGELQGLRDEDVDLAGVIHVRRSWDRVEGPIEPKSRAGVRKVPIVSQLRVHLAGHRLRTRSGGLFFGDGESAFSGFVARADAAKVWKLKKLPVFGFHDARHTYASLSIAAGVNAKALSTYMGHSSITITLDRYGHLLPGNEAEAAALLDSYLAGPQTGPQAAQTVS